MHGACSMSAYETFAQVISVGVQVGRGRLITVTTVSDHLFTVLIPMDVGKSARPLLRTEPGSPTVWSGVVQVRHASEQVSAPGSGRAIGPVYRDIHVGFKQAR